MYRRLTIPLLVFGLGSSLASAQDLYVYPSQGQSKDQQEQDQFQCYEYGRNETGFDPMATPTATSARPQEEGTGVVGGAARGALLGAAIGAIAGDTGQGAAIGAVGGGAFGGMRRRQSDQQQEQWEQEQAQQYAASRSQYNRAYAACLEGRGYTVR